MRKKRSKRKDPAFLFYPGDYLRDTQCLSESAQVAYDRIMCEHMRVISLDMTNIKVSKERVEFFTKRLDNESKYQIFSVLNEVEGGYQIEWVAISIYERKTYTESRKNNKLGKNGSHDQDILTHDRHTEDEDEIENKDEEKEIKKGRFFKLIPKKFENDEKFWEAWKNWIDKNSERGTEINPKMAKKQLEFLEQHPDPVFLLTQAFANNWMGIIYKDKTSDNQQTTFEPKIYTYEELRDMYFKQGYFTQNSKKGDPIAENYMMIDTGYEYPMYILKSQFNSEKHKVWNKNKTDVKKEAAEIRASEAKEEKDMILDQWKRFKNLDKELSKKEKEEFNEAMKKKNYIKSENLLLSKEGKKTEKTIEPKTAKDLAHAITA